MAIRESPPRSKKLSANLRTQYPLEYFQQTTLDVVGEATASPSFVVPCGEDDGSDARFSLPFALIGNASSNTNSEDTCIGAGVRGQSTYPSDNLGRLWPGDRGITYAMSLASLKFADDNGRRLPPLCIDRARLPLRQARLGIREFSPGRPRAR